MQPRNVIVLIALGLLFAAAFQATRITVPQFAALDDTPPDVHTAEVGLA